MNRFKITKYGYIYDKVIFISLIFLLLLGFFFALKENNFNFNKQYIYYECVGSEPCRNPLKELICTNELVWGKDCSIECKEEWCYKDWLLPDQYGEKEPQFNKNFPNIAFLSFIICLLLNHVIHNKKNKFDIEIVITKNKIINLRDIIKELRETEE